MFAGVVVGFASDVVTVAEDGRNAVLTVVLNGSLERNVTVKLITNSDTALGKMHKGLLYLIYLLAAPSDYTATSVDLTFTPGVNSLTVSVPIIDNGILEGTEQFFGDLSTSDPDVDLRPQRTTIKITDDDGNFIT